MDEDEEYSDTREELLNRFRDSLGKPLAERFFDEGDLVEIFDYAGDLNDDFLRMEVLMCGARFFPDSEELLERRGIFYSQYSDEAREQFLAHNPPDGNLILELLNLRAFPPKPEEARKCLDSLLAANQRMDDEEIIQVVDLASSLSQYSWLKDNLEALRTRNDFTNVLLFETAIAAENAQDFQYSAKLLEELTEIEPFNSYYWMMLSRQYAELDDVDKALNAIDYSLAIKPDSSVSLLVKAKLLYALEHPIEEVIDIVRRALEYNPADVDCLRFLASLYNASGHPEQASALLQHALNEGPISGDAGSRDRALDLIPDLLMYNPENPAELFDRFFSACEENNQIMWASWAQQLSLQGYPTLARKCLECFERNTGQRIPSVFEIEEAFRAKNYMQVINSTEDYLKAIGMAEHDFPAILGMHVIALVKMNNFLGAYTMCNDFFEKIDISNYKAANTRLEYMGLAGLLSLIKSKIEKSTKPRDWDDFDPLAFWT
ncbi:MAG: hypothetical protein LUD17_07985 [Bacteroidales bacterium]|nr:hypothetical protein [Bacteroidales bacterium]